MKIALLNGTQIPTPPPAYGSEIVTWWLARTLAERGHDVHLVAPGGSYAPAGVRLHVLAGSSGASWDQDANAWAWYRDVLRSCDVLHDLSPTCAAIEEAYLDNPLTPTIYTRNGIDFAYPRFGRHNAVVLSDSAKDAAQTGTSAWVGTPWADQYPDAVARLDDPRVIPYGVDTAFYQPRAGASDDYVLYLGRPHMAKGIDLILDVARRLPQQRFVIAWRPLFADHHAFDQQFRREAAAIPNVKIVALPYDHHHEAKRALYQRARLFLSPNRYREAFGLTAAEALACGTPVLLGANGAGPEITQATGTTRSSYGAVVDANAAGAIEAIVAAVRATDWDRQAARDRATTAYSLDRMATDYEAAYQDVIDGKWWNR